MRISRAPDMFQPFRTVELSLAQFEEWLSTPEVVAAKKAASFWSPTWFKPDAKAKTANDIEGAGELIVLDVDKRELPDAFNTAPYLAYAHGTFSGKWRVVIPLSRPISVAEFPRIHSALRAIYGADDNAGDITRGYYAHSQPEGAPTRFIKRDGPLANPEELPAVRAQTLAVGGGFSYLRKLEAGEAFTIREGGRHLAMVGTMFEAGLRGRPLESTWEQLVRHLEDTPPELDKKAVQAWERGQAEGVRRKDEHRLISDGFSEFLETTLPLELDNKGKPANSPKNLQLILETAPVGPVKLNRMSLNLEFPPGSPLAETPGNADTALVNYVYSAHGIRTTRASASDQLAWVGERYSYSPVEQYLKALPEWDQADRITNILQHKAGADGNHHYINAVFKRFLISAVARGLQPGTKVDTMLILHGHQGIGKSQLVRALGGEFAGSMHLDPSSKDTVMYMAASWLVEIAELAHMHRADVEHLKALMSRTHDTVRLPYARAAQTIPRQCVMIGTTNASEFLRDATGERRYWPVTVGEIDVPWFAKNRDQIWAQAKSYYEQGVPWWVPKDEEAMFASEVSVYSDTADTEDLIALVKAWFLSKPPHSRPPTVSLSELIAACVMIDLTSQRYAAVRKAMRSTIELMGFRKVSRKGAQRFVTPDDLMKSPQTNSAAMLLEARRVDTESISN